MEYLSNVFLVLSIILLLYSAILITRVSLKLRKNPIKRLDFAIQPIKAKVVKTYKIDLTKLYSKYTLIETGKTIYTYIDALSVLLKYPYKETDNPYKKFLYQMALIVKLKRQNDCLRCKSIEALQCAVKGYDELKTEELTQLKKLYNDVCGDYNKDIVAFLGEPPKYHYFSDMPEDYQRAVHEQNAELVMKLAPYDRWDYNRDRLYLLYGAIYLYYKEIGLASTYNYDRLRKRFFKLLMSAYGFEVRKI